MDTKQTDFEEPNEQYIPKVGDRVKLIELHKNDAFYYYWKRGEFLNYQFIIDRIDIWDEMIDPDLFPFVFAYTHDEDSGKEYAFCAAKFVPAPKYLTR